MTFFSTPSSKHSSSIIDGVMLFLQGRNEGLNVSQGLVGSFHDSSLPNYVGHVQRAPPALVLSCSEA